MPVGVCVCRIASVDEFIAQLWNIYKEVKAEGFVQVGRQLCNYLISQCSQTRSQVVIANPVFGVDRTCP